MKGARDDTELMRLFDGELAAREARAAEQRAASSEARAKLESLEAVREVVRDRYARASDEAGADLDALWSRIEPALDRPVEQRESGGWLAALREWLEAYRGHLAAAAVGVAIGALVMFGALGEPDVRVVEGPPRVVYVPQPVSPVKTVELPQVAEVESLEVAGGTGTVFQIPGAADEAATTVIWVTREEPASGSEDPI